MARAEVSIVIVSWNSWEYLPACLDSIFKPRNPRLEVILVDNDSEDGTPEKVSRLFPQVRLISNPRNLGYARACNQGLKMANAEFVLLLNPDTILHPDSLSRMIEYLKKDSSVGAVGPQLVGPDGRIQPSCRRFPNYLTLVWEFSGLSKLFPHSKIFGWWRMGDFDFQREKEVDQPMASALLVRRSVVETVGWLDERFGMFFNDVDFCFRIKQGGFKIVYFPEAKVTHHLGASTQKRKVAMIYQTHLGFFKYLQKYHSSGLKSILLLLFGAGLFTSSILRIVCLPFKKVFGNR